MKVFAAVSNYSLTINLCMQALKCVLQLEQSDFDEFMCLFTCRRFVSFYCLTCVILKISSNKHTTYNSAYDEAVHPSWAISARSKAPKWACPCSYYALKFVIKSVERLNMRN